MASTAGGQLVDASGRPVVYRRGELQRPGTQAGADIPDPIIPINVYRLPWLADYDHGPRGDTTVLPGDDIRTVWPHADIPHIGASGPERADAVQIVGQSNIPGTGMYRPTANGVRFELRPFSATSPGASIPADGDVTTTGSYTANRMEAYDRMPPSASGVKPADWPDPVGSTRWYSWSFYLDPSWSFDPQVAGQQQKWIDLTQWKGFYGGSPPQAIEIGGVNGTSLQLGGSHARRTLDSAIAVGVWHRIVVGFRWEKTTAGWVNVWLNGNEVLPQESRATMDVGPTGTADPVYFKQGIYRAQRWGTTHIMWCGPAKIGATRAEVM